MTEETTTSSLVSVEQSPAQAGAEDCLALVIAWSRSQPERVGEVARLPSNVPVRLLGRGPARPEDAHPRIRFGRQRAGSYEVRAPLEGKGISREQLSIQVTPETLKVERIGRCRMTVNGERTNCAVLRPTDTLLLEHELLLVCCLRPFDLPAPAQSSLPQFEFGEPDAFGFVGESAAAWQLRQQIALQALLDAHVLILGASGTGKELAARALHGLSTRAGRELVSRNSATLPSGLIDAELFGNVANYPNPGMRERPGLIGAADGSSLFFDEIAELASELQAHLLRVLDEGEYQRLGEARVRRSNVRFVGATNRERATLKPDLGARMTLTLKMPGLDERREDIPLIARELLRRAARRDAGLMRRLFKDPGPNTAPAVDPQLLDALIRHDYTLHVRELESLLWSGLNQSADAAIAMTDELRGRLKNQVMRPPSELTPERIQACLDKHGGNQALAYKELGLKNRDVLFRLVRKYGLVVRR